MYRVKQSIAQLVLLVGCLLGNTLWQVSAAGNPLPRENVVALAWLGLEQAAPERGTLAVPFRVIQTKGTGPYTPAFSPDGSTLAFGMNSRVFLWNLNQDKLKGELGAKQDIGAINSVTFSNDGKLLAAGTGSGGRFGDDRTVCVWEVHTGKLLWKLPIRENNIQALAFSANGQALAGELVTMEVRLWDAYTGKELHRIGRDKLDGSRILKSIAFSPDGKTLATGGDRARLWDVRTGAKVKESTFRAAPNSSFVVAFSPDGQTLAIGGGYHPPATSPRNDPNLLIDLPFSPLIYFWKPFAGEKSCRLTWDAKCVVDCLAFSPNGKVLVCRGDRRLHIWEVATLKERLSLKAWEAAPPYFVAFSPDGRTLAASWKVSDIHLWDSLAPVPEDGFPVRKRNMQDLETHWEELGSADAAKGYRAIRNLVQGPEAAVPFLKDRMKMLPQPDSRRIAQLITDLESKRFEERQKATEELEKLGNLARQALRRTLEGNPSLQLRQHAEQLLGKLSGPITSPDRLRAIRGVEVLEHIGTPEATRVLEELSKSTPGTDLTEGAQAAVGRLKKRVPVEP